MKLLMVEWKVQAIEKVRMHFTSYMYVCIVTENVENEAINTRIEDISNGEGKN